MVLGKLPGPECPTNFDNSRQRPNMLAADAGGCCLDIFSLIYLSLFFLLLSLGGVPIWTEILPQRAVKNRGLPGDVKQELIH